MNNNESKQQGLLVLVISVIVILLLVTSFITANDKNVKTINSVSFDLVHQDFIQNIALIRAHWLMSSRPDTVSYPFFDNEGELLNKRVFAMTKTGRPKLVKSDTENYCRALLLQITNTEPDDTHLYEIFVKKQQKLGDLSCQFCEASNNNKCFSYLID